MGDPVKYLLGMMAFCLHRTSSLPVRVADLSSPGTTEIVKIKYMFIMLTIIKT